jgi:hypothetical protein
MDSPVGCSVAAAIHGLLVWVKLSLSSFRLASAFTHCMNVKCVIFVVVILY